MGNKVAIVTGGSSGIGRCTITALAQSGAAEFTELSDSNRQFDVNFSAWSL